VTMKQVWNCSYVCVFVGVVSSEYLPTAHFVEDVDKLFESLTVWSVVLQASHCVAHLVTTVPMCGWKKVALLSTG